MEITEQDSKNLDLLLKKVSDKGHVTFGKMDFLPDLSIDEITRLCKIAEDNDVASFYGKTRDPDRWQLDQNENTELFLQRGGFYKLYQDENYREIEENSRQTRKDQLEQLQVDVLKLDKKIKKERWLTLIAAAIVSTLIAWLFQL